MNKQNCSPYSQIRIKEKRKKRILLSVFGFLLFVIGFFSLFAGPSSLSFSDSFFALFGKGERVNIRIRQNIRLPRILAGIIAGIGLSVSGLIRQSCLDNPMASPSTLGISNAAVLGANVAIILLSGGSVKTEHNTNWNSFNPYAVSRISFFFSFGAIFLILTLAKLRKFTPETIVLAGVCLSSLFSAITTLLQYFATDSQLSGSVYWSFGDLGRVGYKGILILFVLVTLSYLVFAFFASPLNALSLGEEEARRTGINTEILRFILLALSSLIIACCISFFGIIGFIGLICPHRAKKIFGGNHHYLLPSSALTGALLLLLSDDIARVVLRGFSLPVGAVTAILGAPFFLCLLLSYERSKHHA